MKTKLLFILLIFGVALATSCKKESAKKAAPTLTTTQLNDVSDKTTQLFSKIENFMFGVISSAADSGIYISQPATPTSAKKEFFKVTNRKSAQGNSDWFGPDADGWYIKTYNSLGYTYTEKIRCKDTVLTHILEIEYSGGDASYSNITETQFTKYTKNKQVLWMGYTDWKIHAFGDNNISDSEWKFEFTDWDPKTGAGVYDWYWGASSLGGDPVPYHRFLNIIATSSGIPMLDETYTLHVKITWYDDGGVEVGSFEYDTDWTPVEMPDNPCGQ
jgi:hypothetical protein